MDSFEYNTTTITLSCDNPSSILSPRLTGLHLDHPKLSFLGIVSHPPLENSTMVAVLLLLKANALDATSACTINVDNRYFGKSHYSGDAPDRLIVV
ncbi:MAG: hypothetical protein MJE68_05250 [Proteobacteria bacterium]|nr:hypothetical protein [Pseudomonadota bacterium]